jgi:PAS domain S-box-containing protein
MAKKRNPGSGSLGGGKKRDFLHSATIPCLLFAPRLNMIEINPAGLKLFNTKPLKKNLIGKNLSEIIPSIKETNRYDRYLEVIRSGKPITEQISPPHPNFGDVYLDIHAFKVGDGMGIIITDITAQKKAEEELLTRMQTLECMEHINRAIREADDLGKMLDSVLETILSIFQCDRAWLLYPCDPEAPYLRVPMERTRAEYPGAFASKNEVLNTPGLVELEKKMLASKDILVIGPGTEYKVPPSLKAFSVQSQVTIPVYPRVDKPWIFGLHQCSYPRIWSQQELNLFKEISRRFAEALSSLLFLNNLQESEERYRTLFNQAGDAIFLINTDNKIRDVNHRGCQMLQLPREEIIGKSYLDFVHPDYREDSIKRKHGLLAGKTYESYEKIFVRSSGIPFPVEINATSIQLQNGTPKYFQSIVRDITERKQTEMVMSVLYEISKAVNVTPDLESLYPQIHESLSNIIDATNFYIALYDDNKNVITFPYFVDEKDEIFDIIDARDSGSLTAEVIKNGKPLLLKKKQIDERFSFPGKTAVGTPAFAWLGVPLRVQKKLIGVIAVQSYSNANLYSKKDIKLLESVSEQIAIAIRNKQIEEEKKRLEEQLFQAQKMESIGRLAGGIAHDFNNILTGIMGYAELLKIQFSEPNSKEEHAAGVILKGSERAANLTKQLLGFARGGKYNPVPLNVNEVIEEIVNVSEKIFEKNISVTYLFEEKIDTIEADRHQLEQVLTNLIINARDAMPKGGVLAFKTENITPDKFFTQRFTDFKPGNYVKISITDTGIGMAEDIQKHIFEPFFTTKAESKGTGLGLATVYGILKSHNGHINVYSEPGKGSTFSLYFPASDKKIVETKKEFSFIKGEATILVVDDEESVRSMAAEMLDLLGYRVLTAIDGREAIEIFKEKKNEIDLVLLDMIMPNMAGKETYRELKKITPDIKVLLASGYSQNDKTKEILDEGVLGFVQKPFGISVLSKTISEMLNIK